MISTSTIKLVMLFFIDLHGTFQIKEVELIAYITHLLRYF